MVSPKTLVCVASALLSLIGGTLAVQWSGAHDEIWSDQQCRNLGNFDAGYNLDACKKKCIDTPSCTAFNFVKTGGCTLRRCGSPVPLPQWNDGNGLFQGYFILDNDVDCFDQDKDYPGNDIGKRTQQDSAEKCQAHCASTEGCKFFTWAKSNYRCYLKTIKANPTSEVGATSGPKKCPVALALTVAADNTDCFEENINYPGVDIHGLLDLDTMQDSAKDCQALCKTTDNCQFFKWSSSTNRCDLKYSNFGIRTDNYGVTSGPRDCIGCYEGAGGITCCRDKINNKWTFTEGDHLGDTQFVEEYQLVNMTSNPTYYLVSGNVCAATCKTLYKTTIGVTVSKWEKYSNNQNKCWCNFGEPKLVDTGKALFQTCLFRK